MIDQAWAYDFAKEWIAAWNSHDLDRILSHYVEDFEMSSLTNERSFEEPASMVGWGGLKRRNRPGGATSTQRRNQRYRTAPDYVGGHVDDLQVH